MPCDYSKYPPNWKSEIVPRILKRANNRCEVENCGLRNASTAFSVLNPFTFKTAWIRNARIAYMLQEYDMLFGEPRPLRSVKVVLTIAHLDHDEHNHNVKDERLMAMCQLHHLQYDAEEKARRRKNK